jgi:hypothetical protein
MVRQHKGRRKYAIRQSQNKNHKQIKKKLLKETNLLNTSSTCTCNSWSRGWVCISIFTYADSKIAFVGVLQHVTQPNETDAMCWKHRKTILCRGCKHSISSANQQTIMLPTLVLHNREDFCSAWGTTSFSASNLSGECCSCDSRQHTKIYILDSLLEKPSRQCTTQHTKCNGDWLSAYVTVGNLSWTMWNTSLGLQPGRLASRWLYSPSKYPAT